MTKTRDRLGVLAAGYAWLAPVIVLAELGFLLAQDQVLLRATLDPNLEIGLWASLGFGWTVLVGIGAVVWFTQGRRPRHSAGRLRARVASLGGIVHGLGLVILGFVYSRPDSLRFIDAGLGFGTPDALRGLEILGLVDLAAGRVMVLAGSIGCWFLMGSATRARIWLGLDVALVAAVVAAFQLADTLNWQVVRHILLTLALLRLIVRVLPLVLNVVETTGFEALVAARHLRSKKSGFLATISILAILAVTLSCVALTVTLSIMGGFRNDLKRKILGNNAHIVVDRNHASIEDWEPLVAKARGVPRVTGGAPYVTGEVMLSSASNLATAVLRGIDPLNVGTVSDLPKNMRSGKLEYLKDPEKLLDLPPGSVRSGMLRIYDSVVKKAEEDEADAPHPPSGPPDAGVSEVAQIEGKILQLEEFLRDAQEPPPVPAEDDRTVLPGIVIGQELAKSLRLQLGDEVNVVAPLGALGPAGPMPKSRPFRVAGIFYSGMYEYDMKFTYVALETAQRFLNTGSAISGIEIKVEDADAAPAIAAVVQGTLGRDELRVRDWQALNSRLFGALALEKLAMFIALGIAILVASFCITGTLTLMVQEKGREVAILKAMGTADRTIVRVFVIEGGLIGLLGSALGLFLGYQLCFAVEHFGIRMNPEVYYIDRLPVHIDPAEFSLTGIAAVAVCLIVTIYPALLASRLRPVDALRYE